MMVLVLSRQCGVEGLDDGSKEQELGERVKKENDEEQKVLELDEGVVMESDGEQEKDIWEVELDCNLE